MAIEIGNWKWIAIPFNHNGWYFENYNGNFLCKIVNCIIIHKRDYDDYDYSIMLPTTLLALHIIFALSQAKHDMMQCRSTTFKWSHERHGVSNHRQLNYSFHNLFTLTSSKIQDTHYCPLCEWNPSVTSRLPSQRASNTKGDFIARSHQTLWYLSRQCISHDTWTEFWDA